jgi:membrane dipeptidase
MNHGRLALLCGVSMTLAVAIAPTAARQDDLPARARAIHERVLTLDTHVDINPSLFTADCNYTMRLAGKVDIPQLIDGGLDVVFLIVDAVPPPPLTPAGLETAYQSNLTYFAAIHGLTERIAPDKIGLALSPDDVRRIAGSGRKVAVIGIEGGTGIASDLARVREFYDRGARYIALTHSSHNQLADSDVGETSGEWLHHGLSPLGREVVAEMNKVGMIVDLSHASKQAALQTMALSRAPVIASHSAARTLADHSRNLDDETLEALRTNGGVVQVVAMPDYLRIPPRELVAANRTFQRDAVRASTPAGGAARGGGSGGCPLAPPTPPPTYGSDAWFDSLSLTPAVRAELLQRRREIEQKWPWVPVGVPDLVDHIDYLVKKIGIDHVGISSDFGGGGGVLGWQNASETFNVTLELVKRGYSESDIAKIWSGNLLSVWQQVQQVAARKPNFSGTWTLVPGPDGAGGRGGPVDRGLEMTVVQNEKTLTVTATRPRVGLEFVYNLDGSDSRNNRPPLDNLSRLTWDGQKLVIKTTIRTPTSEIETTETWALDESGQLVITHHNPRLANPTRVATYKKNRP